MINIPGSKVIVDSDGLIGLINKNDILHKRCIYVSSFLKDNEFTVLVPYPIVLEAATALAKDKQIQRPDLSQRLIQKYALMTSANRLDTDVGTILAQIYNPKGSKKNSPFDFYVLACAKKNHISLIFSFDSFYKKQGLTLMEDFIKS